MTQDVLQPGGTPSVTIAGVVTVTATQSGAWSVSITGTPSVDVTDRAARLLGHVTVDSLPAADVTDRAARLLGHVTVDSLPSVAIASLPAITGAVTDTPATDDTAALLRLILRELAVTNQLLQAGLNVPDELERLRADPVLVSLVG